MHEFSLAQNIVEIVMDQAEKAEASTVAEVNIDIGKISGIEADALKFCLEVAVKNTMIENANIRINIIKALALCRNCMHEFPVEDLFSMCPKCESFDLEMIQGRELKVKSIKVE